MTEFSTTDTPLPSARDDHTQVIALLNSADMQKRLHNARIQRAKILEARNSGSTEPPDLREISDNANFMASVGPLSWGEPSVILPAAAVQKQPVSARTYRQSRFYSLMIGLISGLALGSGMMWYSGVRFPGPSAAPDVAETLAQEDHVPADYYSEHVEKIASNQFGVHSLPPIQALPANSGLKDDPLDRPLADQSPARPDFGAFHVPQGSDRATVDTASPTVLADANNPPSVLLNPAFEEQIANLTEDSPPRLHQAPVLDAAYATDQQPSKPIGVMVPRHTAQVDTASNSASMRAAMPLQVALHLSPGLSQEDVEDAKATITTAGVKLASTSVASFSVLQSEIRFFHQTDALTATRMAKKMRIRLRDYSTYRPAPVSGTVEIWFAQQ